MIPMGYGIRYSVHTVQVAVDILVWNGTGQGWNFLIVLKVGCLRGEHKTYFLK